MTVLEMQSRPRVPSLPAVRWTEVCTTEHGGVDHRAASRRVPDATAGRVDSGLPARVLPAPGVGTGVRACRVESTSGSAVVDDVPTWVLLACGVVFGLVLLLLVALMGGPAYA